MDLARLLEESAKRFSWRKCLVSTEGKYSFRSLNKKVNQLAFALKHNLGLKPGEKVAILLNNGPDFIISLFAVFKSRAVCVPLNAFLTSNELKYILQDSGTRFLISSSEFAPTLDDILQEKNKQPDVLGGLEQIILTDQKKEQFLLLPELIVARQTKNPSVNIEAQDLALLIYTSGTTGFPKGVMLTHGNLCANVLASLQALEFSPSDRLLLILPMFHSFTLMVCILIPIYAGARIIIIKSVRPFQKVLRSILLNRVSIIVGIPPLYDIFKELKLPAFLQMLLRVKICISGAAPLSLETLRIFKEKFKRIALLEGYGLTEASPVVSLNPWQGRQKPGSIGLPLPGVQTKIVNDDESEVACGEVGELIVKGDNVMAGYLNRPQETKQTIKGGWLFTGDMAKIDEDGYIYIVGRKKEMILSHGMNIYPSEIENILKSHPKIKEAAVVGKKDKFKGEVPFAFIVLQPQCQAEDQEIIDYCKGRLANYKIPRLIEFRADLPKTPTGKILKRKLVQNVAE